MKQLIGLLLIGLVSAGFGSELVRKEFATLEQAKRENAFSRGWPLPVLPDGTVDIAEINDLDLKRGNGAFRLNVICVKENPLSAIGILVSLLFIILSRLAIEGYTIIYRTAQDAGRYFRRQGVNLNPLTCD